MKNYIGFVNDHSVSMSPLVKVAISDYNSNIKTVCEASSAEMLDTVVSVVGIGVPTVFATQRQVVISNPHVLKPVDSWPTPGNTPLYDGIADMISLFESLPDYNSKDVSFLVFVTTDGQEYGSRTWNKNSISKKIESLQQSGRWTFVFRIPKGCRHYLDGLGIPFGNIYEWDTTEDGMRQSTVATKAAMSGYYTQRSAGAKSSSAFYADASAVNVKALKDITNDVSLYYVEPHQNGIEIKPFIEQHRMTFLKGAAFYQLTKTEARVTATKLVLVRDRNTGKIYGGVEARQMIGLPTTGNARVHPGDHKNYDIFIQSESVNRKLVGGTGVVYYPAVGTMIKDSDPVWQGGKGSTGPEVVNGVIQLPAVPVSTKPTPSPIQKTAKQKVAHEVAGKAVQFFSTRDNARAVGKLLGKQTFDATKFGLPNVSGQRWFHFL